MHHIKNKDIGLYQDKELDLDVHKLQKNLIRALPYMKKGWGRKQHDEADKLTDFIYNSRTYYEVIKNYEQRIPEHIKNTELLTYTLHRWYNYLTSITVEGMFCQYNIVRAEENKKHKFTDIHILEEPFDIKLTVLPEEFYKKHSLMEFNKREVRDKLIRWMYYNQSKQRRFHNANRLFVVCRGKEFTDKNFRSKSMKHKFDKMENKIHNFLLHTKELHNKGKTPFNRIKINHKGVIYTPFSEIIVVNE